MSNNPEPQKGKKTQMRAMFDCIAPSYDRLNHLLSMQIDRLWRRKASRMVAEGAPHRILDLATGTGDLAIELASRLPEVEVLGLDLSPEMLAVARKKIQKAGLEERVQVKEGDAEALPVSDGAFDCVTVGFGVRNFAHLELCLQEMHRVLRDGGEVMILELSTPNSRLIRALYTFYSFRLMPFIGGLISGQRQAYRYLPASVHAFHAPERVVELLQAAGFQACRAESLTFGIAHIYTAKR